MLPYAAVCCRMLPYADVCWRMLTYGYLGVGNGLLYCDGAIEDDDEPLLHLALLYKRLALLERVHVP